MTPTQQDMEYYKGRVILICSKEAPGALPGKWTLISFLRGFGIIHDLRMFYVRDGVGCAGSPNTAIVIFKSRNPIPQVLDSSKNESKQCFWQIYSVTTHALLWSKGVPDAISRHFSEMVENLVRLRSNVQSSGFDDASPPLTHQPSIMQGPSALAEARPGSENIEPPAKRLKVECPSVASSGSNADSSVANIVTSDHHEPGPSQTASGTSASPEWTIRRIAQLEAELHTMRAERDMAISEQDVARMANQAEQSARRQAMTEKSTAEAALSRGQVEQSRLRAELETALAQKASVGERITNSVIPKLAQSPNGSERSAERIRGLEQELEETEDRAHKLHLRILHMEEQQKPGTIKLDNAKAKIKRLKSELNSTQEQLDSAQKLLESKEHKYRQRYKSTKEKLRACEARLNDEQMLMERLKDTLTPEAYQSLGHMHKTLGAFLSTMELPAEGEGGIATLEELD
ncbi:hypothetical protein V565_093810 [Rhizoctonia solani 123E]|uniref:Uncharacterized protein n=1 Tax=Rhizoctonia solani 123E TaxID=1423351 RepID=A0A074RWV4_9AGAM|nr:hypothetical protein V565_093810 [Rhizoctonia solani 123E]